MDPYCGWNELQEACTSAPDDNPLARFWTQSFTSCPVLNTPGKRIYSLEFTMFIMKYTNLF